MTKKLLIASTAILAITFTSPVFADQKDERIHALEAQLEFLMGEIQSLKAERNEQKEAFKAEVKQEVKAEIETEMQAVVSEATADVLQYIQPAAGGGSGDVKISMNPSPKFKSGNFSAQPFGRIQIDAATFDDDALDQPNGAEVRRARLGVKGTVTEDFAYKLEVDFANDETNLKDAYVSYTGIDHTEIKLGNFKPSFTLEKGTSSNDTTFVERAAPADSFAQSQQIGLGASTYGDKWFAAAGVFNDDAGVESSDDEAFSVTGRVVGTPIKENGKLLHFGASGSYRVPDQSNDQFDFDSKAENKIQTVDSVSAKFTDGDDAFLYGLEAAATWGPFSVQGEYIAADVSLETGGEDLHFDGLYGQASYVLTGESRPYSMKKAAFKRIKPDQPFSLKDGTWGAWEIAARYSHLDVSDNSILGGELDSYTIGLNWYPNDHIRFLLNYINVDTDENAVTPNDDPQLLLFRAQVAF